MGVGNTGVKERDGRTFPSQWVKMCVSMFATLVLSVAVAECRYVSVRNGDKVTLPCGQHNGSCEGIDWLFNWRFYVTVHLVEKGKVSQRYVEEYGQLSLTSDCSLEIMKITEELAGQFHCRWGDPFQSLARIYLSVVSMTITENHQLSCSLKPQDECTSFVRWLYYGKPLDHEPKNGWQHTIPLCQDCEEPLREELFSCEVWNDCSGDQSVFPLSRQSEGHKATTPSTPTKTTMLSSTTGSTGGNSEETQPGVPGWWRHLVAVLVVAVLMCILVNFILSKRAKGKKKLQEENTVEPEAGVSSPSVSYTKKGAKVRAQVTDGGEAASSGGAADESTIYCNVSTLDG